MSSLPLMHLLLLLLTLHAPQAQGMPTTTLQPKNYLAMIQEITRSPSSSTAATGAISSGSFQMAQWMGPGTGATSTVSTHLSWIPSPSGVLLSQGRGKGGGLRAGPPSPGSIQAGRTQRPGCRRSTGVEVWATGSWEGYSLPKGS